MSEAQLRRAITVTIAGVMSTAYPELYLFLNRRGTALELLTALLAFCQQKHGDYKTWYRSNWELNQPISSTLSIEIYRAISNSNQSHWHVSAIKGGVFDWVNLLNIIPYGNAPEPLLARLLAEAFTDYFKEKLIKQYFKSRILMPKDQPIKPGDLIFCPSPDKAILKSLYRRLSMKPDKRKHPIPDSPTAIFKVANKEIFGDLDVILDLSLWYPLRRFLENPSRVIPAICIPTPDFNEKTYNVKTWDENGKFFYFTIKLADDEQQTKVIQQAIDASLEEGGSILVFPEFSCNPSTAAKVFSYVKPNVVDRLLLVLGSWHGSADEGHQLAARYFWRDQDGRVNEATISHKKFNPFEGYKSQDGQVYKEYLGNPPRQESIRIYQCDSMSFTTLICKDALDSRALSALDELAPTFILVPAMSETHDLFATLAVKAKGWQGTTIVSMTPTNLHEGQPPTWGMFHGPCRDMQYWVIGAPFVRNARNAEKIDHFQLIFKGEANKQVLSVPAACIIKLAEGACVWRAFPA